MLDEAKNINKSLSSLGNVISALAEGTVSNSALNSLRGFSINLHLTLEIHFFDYSFGLLCQSE